MRHVRLISFEDEPTGNLGLVDTYCAIRDAIEPHAKRSDIEGREFRLSYGNGRASCVEICPEEIY